MRANSLLGASVRRGVVTPVELPLGSLLREADLAGLGILGHIWANVRGHDQDSRRRIRLISDLVAAVWASWQRHDVSLAELSIACGLGVRRNITLYFPAPR